MLIRHRKSWELPESQATPEPAWLDRRTLLGASAGLIAASAMPGVARAQPAGLFV